MYSMLWPHQRTVGYPSTSWASCSNPEVFIAVCVCHACLLTAYRLLENTVIIIVVVVITGCTIYRTDLLLIVDKK